MKMGRHKYPALVLLAFPVNMDWICGVVLLVGLSCCTASGRSFDSVQCDSTFACPNSTTCCQGLIGTWRCCPLVNAVCCPDGIHCCAQGKTCSRFSLTCGGYRDEERQTKEAHFGPFVLEEDNLQPADRTDAGESPMVESYPAASPKSTPPNQPCSKSETPCIGPTGIHCCPFPMASCCLGGLKCCQRGSICFNNTCRAITKKPRVTNPAHSLLYDVDSSSEDYKGDVSKAKSPLKDVPIRQKQDSPCPSSETPCASPTGFRCCPYPMASCCLMGQKCCRPGTVCYMNQCRQASTKPTATHPRSDLKAKTVTSCSCQSTQTCCMMTTGDWGCCPQPNAVCCPDQLHCCPHGYTCGPKSCKPNNASLPWMTPVNEVKPADGVDGGNPVQCDASYSCRSGQTCCKMATGSWRCCPYTNASCCADGLHCCPSGYTCDATMNKCKAQSKLLPWLSKISAYLHSSHLDEQKLFYKPFQTP